MYLLESTSEENSRLLTRWDGFGECNANIHHAQSIVERRMRMMKWDNSIISWFSAMKIATTKKLISGHSN